MPDADALGESLGANLARIHAVRPPRNELADLKPPAADHAFATIAEYHELEYELLQLIARGAK